MREHIDGVSEQVKEVYAYFGLAMYMAQCLERKLAITLATRYGPGPTEITRAEYDDLLNRLFSRTLGQLVRDIGKLAELNPEEEERLQRALRKRNWLAHRYFWERAADFFSEAGRVLMIRELQEAVKTFEALDQLFVRKTMEWAEPRGITHQSIEQEMERLLRSRDNPQTHHQP